MAIKLIIDKDSVWSQLFKTNLESIAWSNKKMNQKRGNTFTDKLIFSTSSGFGKFQYTKSIWNAGLELRKLLVCEIEGNEIPEHWAIQDVLKLTSFSAKFTKAQLARIVYLFGRIQVKLVKDLWDKNGMKWTEMEKLRDQTRENERYARLDSKTNKIFPVRMGKCKRYWCRIKPGLSMLER
jgi:hypothetical protein